MEEEETTREIVQVWCSRFVKRGIEKNILFVLDDCDTFWSHKGSLERYMYYEAFPAP